MDQHARAEVDLAFAAAINLMVEAETSPGTTPEGPIGRATTRRPLAMWADGPAMARRLTLMPTRSVSAGGPRTCFAGVATLFACGAGDGNRTRTVSLGTNAGISGGEWCLQDRDSVEDLAGTGPVPSERRGPGGVLQVATPTPPPSSPALGGQAALCVHHSWALETKFEPVGA
jgi:hypothetical protein